jgi:hypothetical protein
LRKYLGLWHLFVLVGLVILGCAFTPETDTTEPLYNWSSFFNNDCGPMMQFKLTSEDEAILNYPCSNGIVVSQMAKRHKRQSDVELWTASDLPLEQLYKLSNSKCRASLIYLGPAYATVKFPCALVHLTVTCVIVRKETMDATTVIQLKPTKVLITYGDGIQEFGVEEDRLIPLGPFKPFKTPQPSLPVTFNKGSNHPFYLAAKN